MKKIIKIAVGYLAFGAVMSSIETPITMYKMGLNEDKESEVFECHKAILTKPAFWIKQNITTTVMSPIWFGESAIRTLKKRMTKKTDSKQETSQNEANNKTSD